MPAPHGKQQRDRNFLLRMTAEEDAWIRRRAARQRGSINDALTGLIQDAMDAEAAAAPPAPDPHNMPRLSEPPGSARKGRRRPLAWGDLDKAPREPGPGQTAVPDEDQ